MIKTDFQLATYFMNIAFRLFLVQSFAISSCFSQGTVVRINRIPPERILLDKGWKFHAGDDSAWAKSEYDEKKIGDKVELKVKDNGNGIPQKVIDKIFEPFFTTKPTGQGTGLGLSLSYDIVIAHGGKIKVEAKGGEGSEFIIQLPLHHYD